MKFDIEKVEKDRLASLINAYNQLTKALDEELNPKEVDPEKRKMALALYKQAADDSNHILKQIKELIAEKEEPKEQKEDVKDKTKDTEEARPFTSAESRY